MEVRPFLQHLQSADDLLTTYEAKRAGFISLALEKNRQATPFVQQARALRSAAATVKSPRELLTLREIEPALLVAAGVSDKATAYLEDADRKMAISALIQDFLEPQGEQWIAELVYRFLLTRGDTLGGAMRNIAGTLAQRKMTRAIISALAILGHEYEYLDSASGRWLGKPENDADIELRIKGLSWQLQNHARTLVYNIKVPAVNKNVDLCLLDCSPTDVITGRVARATYRMTDLYIALGELKGGIDPAGADEHWTTAQSALNRIQRSFAEESKTPHLFFVGAAIEKDMANEIWEQLNNGGLENAANLTDDNQVASLCMWLCHL